MRVRTVAQGAGGDRSIKGHGPDMGASESCQTALSSGNPSFPDKPGLLVRHPFPQVQAAGGLGG